MAEDPEQAELDVLEQEERHWQKLLLIAKKKEAVKKAKEATLEVEGRLATLDEHPLRVQSPREEVLLTPNMPPTTRQRSGTAAPADQPPLKRI